MLSSALLSFGSRISGRAVPCLAELPACVAAAHRLAQLRTDERISVPKTARLFSTAGSTGTEAAYEGESPDPSPPRVVVFGGNGYVGTNVCKASLNLGLAVSAVGRSGRPPYKMEPWGDEVDWVAADALQPESYSQALEGAAGVICCIGGFGSNETMLKVNGEANIRALEAAAAAGVLRAVFVSAHDYKFPSFVLQGYFQGKRNAESALQSLFPDSGVILRPGFIHGTRMVGSTGLPLGLIGQPLEQVLKYLPTKQLVGIPLAGVGFVPPVSVEKVARVAAVAVSDSSVDAGILDPWELQAFAA
mmetsp:Transcript_4723/g.13105  ORF Transcript_4723/g.13105 Transcript_4723/m.13105 type:complete len:304 (+) Transcript_4723:209-1120(+)|eukprot:CAMPEP_0117675518 /NCGR_PEP_ID=MMETSP0804-20121206/15652_1 /TAXON_ID=1074897 /ORGANISM="Tetraselmis astigmatica, Strain CCMP880" /LENGTH=303 /DNA_ID=CAMNT_0005484535 /DNA_START=156 /DNA_END=1067 /DNA_ORIENTATION=-